MANRKDSPDPVLANPLVILTVAESGMRVAIAGMWVKTVQETRTGTVITLTDNVSVAVDDRFSDVMALFAMHDVRGRGTPLE